MVANRRTNNTFLSVLNKEAERLLYSKKDAPIAKARHPKIQNKDHSVVITFIKSTFLHTHSTLAQKYKKTYQKLKRVSHSRYLQDYHLFSEEYCLSIL